ncbi:MAG: hypothetical protein IJO94_04070 [Firmicutes bacterium]|nr:hypothetical protein [Bacillota bacterium]
MAHYTTEIKESHIAVADFLERFVDVEKFLGYCKECKNYGVHNACPPYDFDSVDFWKEYSDLKVVGLKITFDPDFAGKELDHEEWTKLYKEIIRKESRGLYHRLKEEEEQAENRILLNPGSCIVCGDDRCDRRKAPCAHPELRRFSIESLGGDVPAVSKEVIGLELKWIEAGKVPEYLVLVGGMLYK